MVRCCLIYEDILSKPGTLSWHWQGFDSDVLDSVVKVTRTLRRMGVVCKVGVGLRLSYNCSLLS